MEKIYIVNDLVKKDYILKNKDEKVLTKKEFIKGLKWLESDPMVEVDGKERVSRAIGCKKDGTLEYGEIYYFKNFRAIYPINLNLSGLDFPKMSINKRDIL